MGPLFVLILWATVAAVLSVVGGAILTLIVRLLTRGVVVGRKRATLIAAVLPAAGFAYLFCCVMIFSVWSSMRGRDWGWGDTWDTPIAGDYHLMMIDVTDKATVYSRSDSAAYDGRGLVFGAPNDRKVIFGVHKLEVRGPLLLGSANPATFMEEPPTTPDNLFFLLNTKTGERVDFPSLQALEARSTSIGQPLHLEPVDAIYGHLRYTWFDLILLAAFSVLPIMIAFLLLRGLLRLRRSRPSLTQSPS